MKKLEMIGVVGGWRGLAAAASFIVVMAFSIVYVIWAIVNLPYTIPVVVIAYACFLVGESKIIG